MNELKIEIPLAPEKSDINFFYQSVHEENQSRSSHSEVHIRPSFKYLFLRDQQNSICGGASAHFVFDVVYVDALWVQPSWRRQGAASSLYRAIEEIACLQKKQRAIVTTFEYQNATDFWIRMGFTQFAALPGAIEGSRLIYMHKTVNS